MTYDEKLAEIVGTIGRKTLAGEVTWSVSPLAADASAFLTYLGDINVIIRAVHSDVHEAPDDAYDIELGLRAVAGAPIESIRDTRLKHNLFSVRGYSSWFAFLEDVLETARRQALGTEKAIDTLLERLRS